MFIALANTVVSLYYYLLIVKALFINQADEYAPSKIRTDNYNRISIALCTAAVLMTGLASSIYKLIEN